MHNLQRNCSCDESRIGETKRNLEKNEQSTLREKGPYSEFFWSVSLQDGEILRISPYSVRMRKNTD